MIEIKGTHKEIDKMISIANDCLGFCYNALPNKNICTDCPFDGWGGECEIGTRNFTIIYTD